MEAKDIVSGAAATIGCVTGIISLIRLHQIEKRLFLEPYFKAKWEDFRIALERHLSDADGWLNRAEKSEKKGDFFRSMPESKLPDMPAVSRRYARDLARALASYRAAINKLSTRISKFNDLRDPTSEGLASRVMMSGLVEEVLKKKSPAEQEEWRRRDKARREAAVRIFRQYLGNSKDQIIGDLVGNTAYQYDLNIIEADIERLAVKARKPYARLLERLEVYAAKFNESEQGRAE